MSQALCYLIRSEQNDLPEQAAYKSAVHRIFSDDPEATWDRYFRHMVSSTLELVFPKTRILVSTKKKKIST